MILLYLSISISEKSIDFGENSNFFEKKMFFQKNA